MIKYIELYNMLVQIGQEQCNYNGVYDDIKDIEQQVMLHHIRRGYKDFDDGVGGDYYNVLSEIERILKLTKKPRKIKISKNKQNIQKTIEVI